MKPTSKWTPEYNREQSRLRAAKPEVQQARRDWRAKRIGLSSYERRQSLEMFDKRCGHQLDRIRRVLAGDISVSPDGIRCTVDPVSSPDCYDFVSRR